MTHWSDDVFSVTLLTKEFRKLSWRYGFSEQEKVGAIIQEDSKNGYEGGKPHYYHKKTLTKLSLFTENKFVE